MGIEPYLLRSGLLAILCQRLLRRLCHCNEPSPMDAPTTPWSNGPHRVATGCPECHESGYISRGLIAEWLNPAEPAIGEAILNRHDSRTLHEAALSTGHIDLAARSLAAGAAGWTTPQEVTRVLGLPSRRLPSGASS